MVNNNKIWTQLGDKKDYFLTILFNLFVFVAIVS